jgi:dTDP-4-amino-4,6-dideoxygalactose transaminase
MISKTNVAELAIFEGAKLFDSPKSTSNLVQPDFERFLDYSKQFFNQRHYTNNGPLVRQLEKRLADFHQARFCVTFCSGFWAIALAMKVLALPGRNEILMPSLSYRRIADIAAWARLKPRFCEVEADTLTMSARTAAECINDQTALIIGMHPIINCCDVAGLVKLAAEHQIPLLFDTVESVYEGCALGKTGSFGDAECFSLHASKLINGFEGGYVTTNNEALAGKLALLRAFGFKGQDNIAIPGGLNAKLNEVHAAMTLANLDGLEAQVARNRERYERYKRGLSPVKGIRLVQFDETWQTSYKNILVELLPDWPLTRARTLAILHAENIVARPYYSPPLHQKKMRYPHIPASLPLTESLAERFVLLPCGEFVTVEDIDGIITLLDFLGRHGPSIEQRATLK